MSGHFGRFIDPRIDAAANDLKAAIYSLSNPNPKLARADGAPIFVTVSRQAGAGAISFSHRLAERLSAEDDAKWSAWDHELVEKVSSEHGISRSIIEMLTDRQHTWLDEVLASISPQQTSDVLAYKKVAMTIRALATAGHAIIVGQGGVFVTAGMPGGIHLRLIAPLEHRIKTLAENQKLPIARAAEKVLKIEENRQAFFKRYWPRRTLSPEVFTLTLNSGLLSVDDLVECVLPVIRRRKVGPIGKALEMGGIGLAETAVQSFMAGEVTGAV
jgi:cytidylate kinase